MDKVSDWYFAFIFFTGITGFVVAALLFFVNKSNSFTARLLAGFLVCISYLTINFGLMVTSFYIHFPHFWRAFGWSSFCYAPLAYIYVRSVLEQSYSFKRNDIIWFLPALLYTINLLPFYAWTTPEKIIFLKNQFANPELIFREPEGLLPSGWGVWARVLLGIIATIGQFLQLRKWKKRILGPENRVEQNSHLFRWLFLFSMAMAIYYTLIILEFIFHFSGAGNFNYPVAFTISATIFFVCIALLVRPSILYGMTGWLQEPAPNQQYEIATPGILSEKNHFRHSLSLSQGMVIKERLENHFTSNTPFRKTGYTIANLAQELDIPSYQLSAFINQQYGKNFNELVNEYRVNYLAGLLKDSPEYFQFTLEALGKLAGFNTRASFIAAVKRSTGKTPSEFFGKKNEEIIEEIVQTS